ncbi:DNA excision repair protein ERCC-5 [Cladophialophora yegresii CBS 114405]|uniref:DNA excision repair protein ERCC-5 n=1 Tax=Cladophialophora yegresii CBS 114405 TaxID=1182544 RepID=W9WB62_9EURO|nr:DNA excision repair protein ERCC-5 [Cladophialophora yegresii CBS 114405]EXJ65193.1 DNA excision repair protein ERCC-5 [Cladophialophora yegresii CBS 114405]
MGVTGLWTVVAPTARPTQLASLNRKRLAVDASIWIYQFLKAVRDKEGNALRNSHVVGFFRRICKLLYFGIKPVFVFDGGAPVLKRETIRKRARRREGRREDAARTAGKLLAVQVARVAEEEERRRKEGARRDDDEEELPPEQELVYVEEIGMNQKERQAGRSEKFRKKDQYHLPDLDVSISAMGAPNDPRIMSQAELEEYARHFHSGEDINLYDFSKIDFESSFFLSLPPGDRYNILNAARLRSRLRMGYSKEQLDGMFPDRMAFSKFQIERVKERNELTQRLMHLNGMVEGDFLLDGGGRIAGEKGKEYILVKNEGVEGGWALGVVSNKHGTKKENAIDLDKDENSDEDANHADSDEDEFEDVAIEGLNRIPKNWARKRKAEADYGTMYEDAAEVIAKKRKAVYEARRTAADAQTGRPQAVATVPVPTQTTTAPVNDEPLFVPENKADGEDEDDLFEDVLPAAADIDDDDDLQRAIAMSLEQNAENDHGSADQATKPPSESSDEDDAFDLQAALAESRRTKPKPKTNVRDRSPSQPKEAAFQFQGPLPFESLNLGQSLLGKKKSKKIEEELSGGFDRDLGDDAFRKERPPQPMPDWFGATPNPKDMKYAGLDRDSIDDPTPYGLDNVDKREFLRRRETKEVVDLDTDEEREQTHEPVNLGADAEKADHDHPIDLDQDDDNEKDLEVFVPLSQDVDIEAAPSSQTEGVDLPELEEAEDPDKRKRDEEREKRYEIARRIAAETGTGAPEDQPHPTMGEMADGVRAEPPLPSSAPQYNPQPADKTAEDSDFEAVEWSESDHDEPDQPATPGSLGTVNAESPELRPRSATAEVDEDDNENFEDVNMEPAAPPPQLQNANIPTLSASRDQPEKQSPTPAAEPLPEEEFDYLSTDEEDLMRQLAEEAEEHARFTSALHNQSTSTEQAMRDFDAELKALRSQQKRDRRDADEVTQTMIQECQALLRHFGLPYITAPMEAEAQCAELVRLGLVDGIVTDDSDIFLFGGTRIYKNMFNAAKYVECYLAGDLEKEFLLTRDKLVRFAHLLGSDYTEGIPGVGPVTALEILTEFADLDEFKAWTERVQLGRPSDLEGQLTTPFRRKFRKTVQKKLFLPPGFPDRRVDEAYLFPEVDSNAEPFQWGVPDLDKLRGFLMATIGWSQERTDEVLVPVIRDMNKRDVEGTQSNITRYFSGAVGVGASAAQGGGLGGVRGGSSGKALAVGGEGPAFGAAQAKAEATAPRNRSGKESGRMRNAFKRLRGEAERQRRRKDDVEQDGADEMDASDGLGEIQGIEGDDHRDGVKNRDANHGPSTATSVLVDGDGDGFSDGEGDVAGDEAGVGTTSKPKRISKTKSKTKGRPKSDTKKTIQRRAAT